MKFVSEKRAYEGLANAIVKQAAIDYQRCLCGKYVPDSSIRGLEIFFNGDIIQSYTNLDGPLLMRRLQQEVIDCDYDYKELTKLHKGEDEEEF